jgi:hypothetical protein
MWNIALFSTKEDEFEPEELRQSNNGEDLLSSLSKSSILTG